MSMDVKTQEIQSVESSSKVKNTIRPLDILLVLIMGGLLYYGASWQVFRPRTDAAKYECYAVAFWQGVPALHTFPGRQCRFITSSSSATPIIVQNMQQYGLPAGLIHFVASQSSTQPIHALPHEYPLLTIIPFSLGLLVPPYWYQVAFALWMALLAVAIYVVLMRFRSRWAAVAFALYLVVGSWGTAEGRFDLVPSALTLIALVCAVRARWNWAFALLALATLFKFYPLVLLLPFLLAQQMQARDKWYAWRRWAPLATFVAVCTVVMAISLFLSVEGTLAPFSYFGNRPIQVESFSASLIWLLNLGQPQHYTFTYGSLNVLSPLSSIVSLLGTVLLGIGLLYTYWLQWRGKMNLATACLLTLLIVMLTGKVFSPQYLIWVAPFVAYVGENGPRWVVSWCLIGLLTTWVYPYIYSMVDLLQVPLVPTFYPITVARNFLLLGFILSLLIYCSRRRSANVADTSPLMKPRAAVVQIRGRATTRDIVGQ